MTLEIPVEAPPLRVDEAGAVRVGKTRVTLDLVIAAYKEGTRPEELVEQLTTLELADVYAVYAFYLRHQAEVDAYLAERERRAAELRAKIEAHWDPTEFRERLLARRESVQTVMK